MILVKYEEYPKRNPCDTDERDISQMNFRMASSTKYVVICGPLKCVDSETLKIRKYRTVTLLDILLHGLICNIYTLYTLM